MGDSRSAISPPDIESQEFADLDDARAAVAAIAAARSRLKSRKLTPRRTRLRVLATWAGLSEADCMAAAFRAPIRVAADIAHAIRRLAPSSPSALCLTAAVLEWCGFELDDMARAILAMFANHCRYPRPVDVTLTVSPAIARPRR
jgi:hypothetical protein